MPDFRSVIRDCLRKTLTLDAGFEREGVLIMVVDFSRSLMPATERNVFAAGLLDRVPAILGIDAAAEHSNPTLSAN